MKNVHRYNNDSSFIAEYGGSGYSEPWVSVADNVTLVDSFTATSENDGFTDRYTFIKRLPIGKFNVIIPYNNPPSHIDYIYLWKWNRVWTGGLAKGSTKSSNDDSIVVTLTADFSNTNVSTDIEQLHYINPYTIEYMGGTYTYDSISDVTTKTVSNLAYSKRIGNIENHMEFDLADYEASYYRVPVTANFSPFSDTGGDVPVVVAKSSNGSSSDICCFLVTFMDNNVERQCFGVIDYDYVYLSEYDTNGDLIGFRTRFFPYNTRYTKSNGQWYIYMPQMQ